MNDNEVRERLLVVDETCRCCVNNSGCTDQPHRCVNMLVDNDYYYWTASAAEYAFGNHAYNMLRSKAAAAYNMLRSKAAAAYNMLRSKAAAAPPCPWFTRRRE